MTNFEVTLVDKVSEGTYGYMVKLDTTNIKSYDIEFIQAHVDSTGVSSSPSDSSVSVRTLAGYLESESAPDLAFNYTHGLCTIFLKTSVYPYTTDTLITLFGKRNALKMENLSDNADFPDELIELYSAYVIKQAALLRGKPTPSDVERTIMREEYLIKHG